MNFMRLTALVMTAFLVSYAGSPSYSGELNGQSRFLTALQDVPLMPGLKEQVDQSIVFDKPSGRIAESTAYGQAASAGEIHRFYRRTLPQLGWSLMSDETFVRRDERLRITVAQVKDGNVVMFHIMPR